jgi:ABC-type transporter Mla MlaB component
VNASQTTAIGTGALACHREGALTRLVASGEWTIDSIASLTRTIANVELVGDMRLELGQVSQLDTSGALLIHQLRGDAANRAARLTLVGLQDRHGSPFSSGSAVTALSGSGKLAISWPFSALSPSRSAMSWSGRAASSSPPCSAIWSAPA